MCSRLPGAEDQRQCPQKGWGAGISETRQGEHLHPSQHRDPAPGSPFGDKPEPSLGLFSVGSGPEEALQGLGKTKETKKFQGFLLEGSSSILRWAGGSAGSVLCSPWKQGRDDVGTAGVGMIAELLLLPAWEHT